MLQMVKLCLIYVYIFIYVNIQERRNESWNLQLEMKTDTIYIHSFLRAGDFIGDLLFVSASTTSNWVTLKWRLL